MRWVSTSLSTKLGTYSSAPDMSTSVGTPCSAPRASCALQVDSRDRKKDQGQMTALDVVCGYEKLGIYQPVISNLHAITAILSRLI
jgi:hypothetical protein